MRRLIMLNIYTLEDRKYLKWTDDKCEFQVYTELEEIRSFASYYDDDGELLMCFRLHNDDPYIKTSYKWSDLENAMKGIEC